MQFFKIWGFCILAAVAYGIIHDQVTARICIEYFTVGHPAIFATKSPTLLALGWGIIATWWVGALLGVLVGCAARLGGAQKVEAEALVKPTITLLIVMAFSALVCGIIGYVLTKSGRFAIPGWNDAFSTDIQPRFVADWFAHSASYAMGFLGTLVLCVWIIRKRYAGAGAYAAP